MNQIIILAAGKATRMGAEKPKVLLEVDGKPIIRSLLDSLERADIGSIAIVVNEQTGPMIKETLGDRYHYIIQKEQGGTGHAVATCKDALQGKSDNIIVLYGDHPFTKGETIKKMVDLHTKEKAVLTMLTVYVPNYKGVNQMLYDWGRIIRDKDGQVQAIHEMKDCTEQEKDITEVNPAFFCFQADWLWKNIGKLDNNNKQKEYYLTDMVALAMKEKHRIASFSIMNVNEVLGINTPQQLDIARKVSQEKPKTVSINTDQQ